MTRARNNAIKVVMAVVLLCLAFGVATPIPSQATPRQATSPERATEAYTCVYYRVKRGDTLSEIAVRFHTTVATLMRVNHLRTTRIYVGQRLCIPRTVPPPPPPPASGPWQAEYWNNPDQLGPQALVKTASAVNFNWGYGSPDPYRVIADYFSGRYTRTTNFSGGTYRFTMTADDGVRLIIDGGVVFDQYGYVGKQTWTVDVYLAPGNHAIRVDYVERTGVALVQVTWAVVSSGTKPCTDCPPATSNGPWYTEYFVNTSLAGPPAYVTTNNSLSFNWGWNPPAPGIPNANWSARFSQYRYLPVGVYRFVAASDDGVRVYVDDKLVINAWAEQSARTVTGDVSLGAGTHSIRVEYFQLAGVASLRVNWEFLGNPNP